MDEPTPPRAKPRRRVMRPGAKKARAQARRRPVAADPEAPVSAPSIWARRLLMLTRFCGEGRAPMTLVEVDRLTGMVPGQTHAFVRRTQNPHVKTLLAYAALFGVHPAWFITGCRPLPHVRAVRASVAAARDAHALELAKAAAVSEAALGLAQKFRAMPREEFEEARAAAHAFVEGG